MQIPLDYYRILGVPVQSESDSIQSAYNDRVQQLPRREYTGYGITSRKNLLEKAYQVLISESLRQDYDRQYFPTRETIDEEKETPETEISEAEIDSEEEPKKLELAVDSVPSEIIIPTIEIEEELFIGALIILWELGEYEILLNLARPYLEGREKLIKLTDKTEDLSLVWQDLILTVTLTNVELAREQWLQKQYELASASLTQAHYLLDEEQLFNSLKKEIDTDLHRLRPYQIWELLTQENSEFKDRRRAITLLKQMLDLRGGIEGKKSDNSGLDLDDFLKFIQQIRVCLTSAEQQELFEQESQRPSEAASYLAAYALIARGFSEKKPQLIVRAKNILISLTVHQDVYLEQSICALLLGQTTEAEFSLSQSREKQTLKYIQEMSQNAPDLLPGLCLYTEKWLQIEVYPQFKDLTHQPVSLKEYFDNDRVQSYLEQLSQPVIDITQSDDLSLSSLEPEISELTTSSTSALNQFNDLREKTAENTPLFTDNDLNYSEQIQIPAKNVTKISSSHPEKIKLLVTEEQNPSKSETELVNLSSFIEADLDSQPPSSTNKKSSGVAQLTKPQPITKSVSSPISNKSTDKTSISTSLPQKSSPVSQTKSTNVITTNNNDKVIWLFLGLLLFTGLLFLAYKLFTKPTYSSLEIPISESLIELPPPKEELVKPVIPEDIFNQQIALDVVRKWLSAKSDATGPEYNLESLNKVLVEPLLSRWRAEGNTLRNKNAHRRYEHTVAIESAETDPQNPNRGIATARIKEKSQYYGSGALNNSLSYEEELLVKYGFIKQGDNWFIQDVEVLEQKR